MNVSAVSYQPAYINNNYVHKVDKNISFCGIRTAIADKAKNNTGCIGNKWLLTALSPLILLSKILLNNKNDTVDTMTHGIKNEYENHIGNFKNFEEKINEMNNFIDKYSKNDNYAQFVKEALSFLRINFEQNQGCCDEFNRLKPFMDDVSTNSYDWHKFEWYKFIDTINKSAKAAISKNNKNIDFHRLDKNILSAREIMQQNINVEK